MAEGLSAAEVGKEIEHHRHQTHSHGDATGHDRIVTIIEAALLAIVVLLAAWSGYASAKWSTESRITLAEASTARLQANRAVGLDAEDREFDAISYNAWFGVYISGDQEAADIAQRRFRPEFEVAFEAWMETDPFNNPDAPPGPSYMPELVRPHLDEATALDDHADELFKEGSAQAEDADRYVRITVFLATVLFLVGISGHFRVPMARYGLVGVGAVILTLAVILLLSSPKPPL